MATGDGVPSSPPPSPARPRPFPRTAHLPRPSQLDSSGLPDNIVAWTNAHVTSWLVPVLGLDPVKHATKVAALRSSGLHGALLFWHLYVLHVGLL